MEMYKSEILALLRCNLHSNEEHREMKRRKVGKLYKELIGCLFEGRFSDHFKKRISRCFYVVATYMVECGVNKSYWDSLNHGQRILLIRDSRAYVKRSELLTTPELLYNYKSRIERATRRGYIVM